MKAPAQGPGGVVSALVYHQTAPGPPVTHNTRLTAKKTEEEKKAQKGRSPDAANQERIGTAHGTATVQANLSQQCRWDRILIHAQNFVVRAYQE